MEKKIKENKKFQIKILKFFIIISILPLLIISLISLDTIKKTRQKNISELQILAIENANEKIKKFLDEKMEMFNLVISGLPKNITEIDNENLNHLAESLKASAGDVSEISFVDKDGFEIVKKSDYKNIILSNISEKEDFKSAISGKNYFGPIQFSKEGITMRIASSIENKNREKIGVITGIIKLNIIKNTINNIRIGNNGFIYILDSNEKVIVGPNDEFIKNENELKNIEAIKDVILGNTHDGLAKQDSYNNILGEKIIFAGMPAEKIDWFIMSEWPRYDAYVVINDIVIQNIIISYITLLIVTILGILFSRQIVKPIKILKDGAKRISEGNLEEKIKIKTNDEFNELGERFNEMIEALKENKKLKDEFVFISAHELRTPVTAIKGYLSMILDGTFGEVSEKVKENLKIANRANDRLVRLVNDLLEIARNDSGKMKIQLSPVVMDKTVEEVIKELEPLASEKNIKIKYDSKNNDAKIKADLYKLKEVLVNIIGNAIKYTLDNKDIEISHEIKGKIFITRIKDHGIGISKEDAKKLFSKFYRIQNEKTKKIEGTGLGLFICKEIVERMGGEIWVTSEDGVGSTFGFSLLLS